MRRRWRSIKFGLGFFYGAVINTITVGFTFAGVAIVTTLNMLTAESGSSATVAGGGEGLLVLAVLAVAIPGSVGFVFGAFWGLTE